jgi:23S rRNA pseudouridine1911/1915/1917 synthase
LFTGRTHQIRIQFGSRKYPLAGDARYGGGKGKISLWSCRIAFVHPFSGEKISITSLPAAVDSWALFQADLEADTVFAADSVKGTKDLWMEP